MGSDYAAILVLNEEGQATGIEKGFAVSMDGDELTMLPVGVTEGELKQLVQTLAAGIL